MVRGNKEDEILEAAIKIFSDKGYSAATTSEIAKEAGVAEGTIFRYFKTKKDILRKVMTKLIEVLGEKLITTRLNKIIKENEDKDEKDLLKIIIKDRLELFSENREMIKVILTEIQFHEDLRDAFIKNVIMKGKEVAEMIMSRGIERGTFRNVNTTIAIRNAIGMVGAYILQMNIAPELLDVDRDKQIDEIIDMFFYGIAKN